jgi:hypothetical protein
VFVFDGFCLMNVFDGFCLMNFLFSALCKVMWTIYIEADFFLKWQIQRPSHEQTSTHIISCESWPGWRVWRSRHCTRTGSKEEEAGSSEYWYFTAKNSLFLCLAEQIVYQIVAKNVKTQRITGPITWKKEHAHKHCFFLCWLIQLNP